MIENTDNESELTTYAKSDYDVHIHRVPRVRPNESTSGPHSPNLPIPDDTNQIWGSEPVNQRSDDGDDDNDATEDDNIAMRVRTRVKPNLRNHMEQPVRSAEGQQKTTTEATRLLSSAGRKHIHLDKTNLSLPSTEATQIPPPATPEMGNPDSPETPADVRNFPNSASASSVRFESEISGPGTEGYSTSTGTGSGYDSAASSRSTRRANALKWKHKRENFMCPNWLMKINRKGIVDACKARTPSIGVERKRRLNPDAILPGSHSPSNNDPELTFTSLEPHSSLTSHIMFYYFGLLSDLCECCTDRNFAVVTTTSRLSRMIGSVASRTRMPSQPEIQDVLFGPGAARKLRLKSSHINPLQDMDALFIPIHWEADVPHYTLLVMYGHGVAVHLDSCFDSERANTAKKFALALWAADGRRTSRTVVYTPKPPDIPQQQGKCQIGIWCFNFHSNHPVDAVSCGVYVGMFATSLIASSYLWGASDEVVVFREYMEACIRSGSLLGISPATLTEHNTQMKIPGESLFNKRHSDGPQTIAFVATPPEMQVDIPGNLNPGEWWSRFRTNHND